MAEGGIVESILGEDEPAGAEAQERSSAGAAPFAAAVAAGDVGRDPAVSRATKSFLHEQTRLLAAQREELVEQRALRLAQLEGQHREGKLRRIGQGLRVGMQAFLAVVIALVVIGVIVMVADSFASREVRVEAFQAPPALASRGVTGQVVASGVLDTLRKLQDATRVVDKGLSTTGAWASEVKIEVPDTGVSLGEIIRMLHQRFGHDVHIDGELVQTGAGGLDLTVRGDAVPARTFSGGPDDLPRLSAEAAEYIYGRSQPTRYVAYLVSAGRDADVEAFVPPAMSRAASDSERSNLANSLANAYSTEGRYALAADEYRLALSFATPGQRKWRVVWGNLIGAVSIVSGEEAAWREAKAMLRESPPPAKGGAEYVNPAQMTWDLPLTLAVTLQDASSNGGYGTAANIEGPAIADLYGLLHDQPRAKRYLASSDPDDPTTKAEALLLPGYAAIERGDYAAAAPPLDAFYKAWSGDRNLQFNHTSTPCYTGLAVGMSGRVRDAEAIFERVRWTLCYAFWGDVLVHAGDPAGATKVWAEGQRAAPDLPAVPLHRGLYELGLGQFKAAETDIAFASRKAPHWADPLKAWGDLQARQGRWKNALAKYDEALKYAPAWPALLRARAEAARAV